MYYIYLQNCVILEIFSCDSYARSEMSILGLCNVRLAVHLSNTLFHFLNNNKIDNKSFPMMPTGFHGLLLYSKVIDVYIYI